MLQRSLAALVLLQLLGCARHEFVESDAVGEYRVAYNHGEEQLVLRSDHTYSQEYKASASPSNVTNSGRWDFDAGRKVVYLEGALFFSSMDGGVRSPPSRGEWGLGLQRIQGATGLLINEDLGLYFERVPAP